MNGLRVAIVGYGARAEIAAHVATARPGSRVVAIVDPSPAGLRRGMTRYPDATGYATLAELCEAGGVDAAIVTTPDHTHEAVSVELLRAGIPVYLEKPLAITLESADRILETAAGSGTPLYVGHNFRHAGVVRLMREVIERGDIGEVKTVWVRHFVGNGPDYYFKDWHADRSKTGTLLLQKASHDIDVVHYLSHGVTRRVVGMGELMVFGDVVDRRERIDETMPDWFSFDNWPPASNTGLSPIVDVEDVSMMMMTLDNGVLASYQQCHFSPDYWRNYTVIGAEGRLENIGDTAGGVVRVWNRRHGWQERGDAEYAIPGVESGHEDADLLAMTEFFDLVIDGTPAVVSPLDARAAVAAGALAAVSLREGSVPLEVPALPASVVEHFARASVSRP